MKNFPKILFLADEIPQSKGAGSIQFLRLFEQYPKDKIIVVGRKPIKDAKMLECKYIHLNFRLSDRIRLSRFHKLIPDLETLGLINYYLPANIKKDVEDFNPDIVITIMQLYSYYSCAYNFAKSKKLPLYVFCHDDVEEFSRIHKVLLKRLIQKNAEIYQYAKVRLCISPQMVKAWDIRYGVSGNFLYPTPDTDIRKRNNKGYELKQKGKVTIGYAGSLAYGYAEGIKELISNLESSDTNLRVYNNPNKSLETDSKNIQFCGYAATPLVTWEKIQEECDAVILPYSDDIKFKKLYETHFPSKLTEYLSLGMPVIVVGPKYATGMIWANENKEALISISERDPSIWLTEINKLKEDIKYREMLGIKSLEMRDLYFSPDTIQKAFFNFLVQ